MEIKLAIEIRVVVRGGKTEQLTDLVAASSLFEDAREFPEIAARRVGCDRAPELAGMERQAEARFEADKHGIDRTRVGNDHRIRYGRFGGYQRLPGACQQRLYADGFRRSEEVRGEQREYAVVRQIRRVDPSGQIRKVELRKEIAEAPVVAARPRQALRQVRHAS
jgi:hypothetical protein